MGAHYTDDGFIDFRSWLISQGRDVYLAALKDPESLAEVDTDGQSLNFEQYAYAAGEAYAQRRAYEAGPLPDVIQEYIDWTAQYGQEVIDRLMRSETPEKDISAGVVKEFFRRCLDLKYDIYDNLQQDTLAPELLDSLKEDIPEERLRPALDTGGSAAVFPPPLPKMRGADGLMVCAADHEHGDAIAYRLLP